MTRRLAFSSARPRPLASASTLARSAPSRLATTVTFCEGPPTPPAAGLQELERLDVDEVLVLADDVRVPHRLEELLRAFEVPQSDLDAAKALRDVAVRTGAGDDRVLASEAHGLLVEGRKGDAGIEHLEDVDLIHDLEQMLVVGHGVQPVERMRDVDEAPLPANLPDRLRHRHAALDPLRQEKADHFPLMCRLHLLGEDHLDPPDPLGDLTGLQRPRDLVVVRDRDRAQPLLLG